MMGRRKCAAAAGSTAAAVSAAGKHRNVLAASSQHAREHLPTRDAGMHNVGSENQNDNRVQVLEDKPREEFHTFNNNNDSKYLHKKFKKMASATSTTALQEDHTNINRVPSLHENVSNRQSSSHPSSCQDAVHPFKRSENPAILAAAVLANSSLFKYSVGKNSETENNVQINHKDYLGDSNSTAIRDSVKNNVNSEYVPANDGKLSGVSEIREVCETNSKDSTNVVGNGRHVCPYCKLSCAKPSVLQKHIRAHTNERPYPCVPCGFAFKTKSNLYKHCRSRSHALRLHGTEETPNNEEDWSLGSEADAANAAKSESAWSSDRGSVQGDPSGANENSGSELISSERISPSNLTNLQVDSKPKSIYKPKFHKASSFYQEEEDGPHKSVLSPNPDFLNRHISKIISDNEAIVDTIDSPFHRKYSKDNSNQKQSMNESNADLKNDNQPLNLTKNSEVPEVIQRKRCYSESFAMLESQKVSQHPLNPERSIIKDLLLKVRAQGTGLLPVTSESYDVPDSLYVCSLCQIPYKSADNLETHKRHYCKGVTSNSSNSVLNGNVSSVNEIMKFSRPDFLRSNSVHVTLPETYSPNTLAKIASSTLKSPFKRANKPENLVIFKSDQMEVATPLPSPGPLLGNTRLVDTQNISDGLRPNLFMSDEMEKLTRSSPILKRRSESQSSESMSSLSKISDEGYTRSEIYSPPNKIRCTETPTLRSLEELSLSPMRQNATSLQMFGGEVKIVDNAGGTTTMRIEPTSQHSPTFISQSRVSPLPSGPETSSILVRSGLHSGATIVHNPPTPKEPLPSPHPQTPRLLVSMAPNISTPNLGMAGIPTPNIPTFQFPIGPITAYNPLTLPALSPVASPSGATTILHRGKLIPYVPGMPGPNTLGTYSSPSQKLNSKMSNSMGTANTMSMDSGIIRSEKNFKDKLKNMNNSDGELNLKMTDLKLPPHVNMKNSINSLRNNEHLDKKETLNKYGDIISQNSPVSKSIPMIKVNYDDSPAALKSNQNFNKRMAEIKIDELLRKNTEILQKNPTNNMDFNSSKTMRTDFKSFQKVDKMSEEHIENKASPGFSMSSDREKRRIIAAEQFNFENLISKSEILNKPIESVLHPKSAPEDNSSKAPERSETSYFKKSINASSVGSLKQDSQSSKFLRPTTLPLKPGTFTPKKHHGITPNSNTLTLISPETPRPAKAYGQLYLNGHAYTYLGLKCSAKVYYCTLNRPQPTYVPNQHALSMYSNWQVCSESTPHPLGLAPGQAMAHYDSRHRPQSVTVSKIKQDHLLTHSSQWSVTVPNQQLPATSESDRVDDMKTPSTEPSSVTIKNAKSLAGGFESNEEYTYVPGRGRGRYVCSECGIRCKKPSMLKKHIRTHTDVRPFTCKHCSFSFKTKGNLTKHMKSKAHYRKCSELGINPLEGVDGADMSQNMGDSDDDSDTHDDGNEGETESSDTDSCKSRLEHEAAHCLLSLWGGRPAPGLLSTARPTTYPYTPNNTDIPSTSEDSKFSEPPVTSPLNENTSVIRKHPITQQLSLKSDKSLIVRRSNSVAPMDLSKPKDFSKSDLKENNIRHEKPLMPYHPEDILTPVEEPDLLASLALSSSKLPRVNNWNNDEPMFQVYLTEKALQDSRIKQCQYTNGRLRQHEVELDSPFKDNMNFKKAGPLEPISNNHQKSKARDSSVITTSSIILQTPPTSDSLSEVQPNDNSGIQTLAEIAANSVRLKTPPVANVVEKKVTNVVSEKMSGTENAKFVASEYLKVACGKSMSDHEPHLNSAINNKSDCDSDNRMNFEESISEKDSEIQKMSAEHIGVAPKVVVGAGGVGFKLTTPSSEFSSLASFSKGPLTEDGRSVCVVCNKTFSKPSQLLLHINIHYIERPFRCSACAVSFRTRGHLQKHERSGSHHNKVSMTSTFGAATTTNPRPFKCSDCKIAFRIHGHLAKHLRSKMHVMRLECLGKLPFGTFAEIERAGVSLTDIDTTDCDNSLASLQILAQKLHEKDPTKLEKWDPTTMTPPLLPPGPESSDEEEPNSPSPHIMSLGDNESKIVNDSDSPDETNVKYSATNT